VLSRFQRWLIVCGLAAVALAGCQNEEISHYKVPKEDHSQRLVAMILSHGDESWFFKLIGPPPLVAVHREDLDRFVASVRFTGQEDRPLRYEAPAGWKEVDPDKAFGQVAVFRIMEKEQSAMLSVSHAGGELLSNVNRWRRQIGLGPIGEQQLPSVAKRKDVHGDPAWVVDMTSADQEVPEAPPPQQAGLKYTTPTGWKEVAPNRAFGQMAAFRVTDGDRSATVSASQAGGDLLANVNRWRAQLGLDPLTEDQFRKEAKKLKVDGLSGDYLDLTGRDKDGKPSGTLGVIVRRGGETWFLKMTGPAELVGKQKAAFEAFVKSVKFDGGNP
jgi:hypothetical protein